MSRSLREEKKHTRRWPRFEASKDSYDFKNTSKHENRILLQAEPQIGKTGSYLYLIKLLRDNILSEQGRFRLYRSYIFHRGEISMEKGSS